MKLPGCFAQMVCMKPNPRCFTYELDSGMKIHMMSFWDFWGSTLDSIGLAWRAFACKGFSGRNKLKLFQSNHFQVKEWHPVTK